MNTYKVGIKKILLFVGLISCATEGENLYSGICDRPEDILFQDSNIFITNSGYSRGNVLVVSSFDTAILHHPIIHNPKGLAVHGEEVIGVSDSFIFKCDMQKYELEIIDTLRGSKGLNDIAVSDDILAVSDLIGNKVYVVHEKAIKTIDIIKPNGLFFLENGQLLIGTFDKENSHLYYYKLYENKMEVINSDFSIDGIDCYNGNILIGDYTGIVYYLKKSNGEIRYKKLIKKSSHNFCDFTVHNSKLYIPSNNRNEILVYDLKEML